MMRIILTVLVGGVIILTLISFGVPAQIGGWEINSLRVDVSGEKAVLIRQDASQRSVIFIPQAKGDKDKIKEDKDKITEGIFIACSEPPPDAAQHIAQGLNCLVAALAFSGVRSPVGLDGVKTPEIINVLPPEAPMPLVQLASQITLNNSTVSRFVQDRLSVLGFSSLRIDGDFGKDSQAALKQFQRQHNLPDTGKLDGKTWLALSRACSDAAQ